MPAFKHEQSGGQMSAILFLLGILQVAGGALIAAAASSVMHEILGAVVFGMGVLAIGVGVLISKVHDVKISTQKQLEILTAFRDSRKA